jgi:hypothetical protein
MRVSTWIFFGLIAAFMFSGRTLQIRRDVACHHAPCRAKTPPPVDARHAERTRTLEREHDQLQSRGRELDRAIQSLEQSLRTLEKLAKGGGSELAAELATVTAGRERLLALRQAVAARTATAAARVELARAGLEDALPPSALAIETTRASATQEGPLEALERAELERAHSGRPTSRADREVRLTSCAQ